MMIATDPPPETPWPILRAWYGEAEQHEAIKYPAACCLSTVGEDGAPDARIVLVASWDASGFVFATDARSVKVAQLERFDRAALTFYWGPLDRQVRVRGRVAETDVALADPDFEVRPRGSRITAWASEQSRPIADRPTLDRAHARATRALTERETVPRPDHWHAYRLAPLAIELWQASRYRLHDRLLYRRSTDDENHWVVERLAP